MKESIIRPPSNIKCIQRLIIDNSNKPLLKEKVKQLNKIV